MPQEFVYWIMPFAASAAFVTLNEMGDKTQLLAMAFATRIKFWKVMVGVLVSTLLNHGLAVAAGSLLARVPGWEQWIRFIAAILFVIFGVWALKSDKPGNGGTQKRGCGDIATVAIAFFLAEMGDKTQLATITLAAKYSYAPLIVLAGTTTGMMIADGLGIIVGVLLHRKLPDRALKIFAAGLFILFGVVGIYQSLTGSFGYSTGAAAAIAGVAAIVSVVLGFFVYQSDRSANSSKQR